MAGASRRYDGPMGKSDRAFVVGVTGCALAFGLVGAPTVTWVLSGAAVLCVLTLVNRVRAGLAQETSA